MDLSAVDRQKCIPHLLRALEKVDLRNKSTEWQAFAKKLRRLLRDGIRLRKRPDFTRQWYQSRIDRLNRRVGELAREEHADDDTRRLTKRLRRYAEYIFTFLDYPYVPADNNFGERQIRPAAGTFNPLLATLSVDHQALAVNKGTDLLGVL